MSSIEARVSRAERITALVFEVQARRAHGADDRDAAAELLRLVMPTIKRVARRFPAAARGVLELADLEQVGAISALKLACRFRPAPYTFEVKLWFTVKTACRDYVRSHGRTVRVPVRAGKVRPAKISTTSIDEAPTPVDPVTPETLLANAATIAAVLNGVNMLPAPRRELVRRHYGLSGAAMSLRTLGRAGRQSDRAHLARERAAAIDELRARLGPP